VLAACASSSLADELFSQGPPEDLADVGFGFFSHAVPTPAHNFKHADNFVIDAGGTVTGFRWWGIGEGLAGPDIPNVDGFVVEIYEADGLIPGGLLYEESFELGETSPTATGRFNNGVNEYVHEIVLGEAFEAAPGVEYFLAIAAQPVDPGADGWLWEDADMDLGIDLHAASLSWATGQWEAIEGYDSAFEVIGVPAPATLIVLVLAGLRRRR
jgi:uncharacterized protein (TIGR03382 family)